MLRFTAKFQNRFGVWRVAALSYDIFKQGTSSVNTRTHFNYFPAFYYGDYVQSLVPFGDIPDNGGNTECMALRGFHTLLRSERDGLGKGRWYSTRRSSLQHVVGMDLVELFNALGIKEGVELELKDEAASEIMARINELRPREIAAIFKCCAKGHYFNEELFQDLVGKVLSSRMFVKRFSPLQMSTVVRSLGVLCMDYSRDGYLFANFDELLATILKECMFREQMGNKEFDHQGIANFIYGVGLVFAKNEYETWEDATMLVGVILGKVVKNENWDDGFSGFTIQNVSDILVGLGFLQYGKQELLQGLSEKIAESCRRGGFRGIGILDILYGFAHIGYKNEDVLNALSDVLQKDPILMDITDREVANVLHAFVELDFKNKKLVERLCGVIGRKGRLDEMNREDLSKIVHALEELGCEDIMMDGSKGKPSHVSD